MEEKAEAKVYKLVIEFEVMHGTDSNVFAYTEHDIQELPEERLAKLFEGRLTGHNALKVGWLGPNQSEPEFEIHVGGDDHDFVVADFFRILPGLADGRKQSINHGYYKDHRVEMAVEGDFVRFDCLFKRFDDSSENWGLEESYKFNKPEFFNELFQCCLRFAQFRIKLLKQLGDQDLKVQAIQDQIEKCQAAMDSLGLHSGRI